MTYTVFSSYNYYYMKKTDEKPKLVEKNLNFLLQKFIEHLHLKNKSKKTIINYYHDVHSFLIWHQTFFGKHLDRMDKKRISLFLKYLSHQNNTIEDVQRNHWSEVFLKLFKRKVKIDHHENVGIKLSANTRKRKLSSISQFFNFLIADESLGKKFSNNPVNKTLHSIQLKDVEIHHTKRLSIHDFNLLLEKNYRIKEQLILHLLFYGGLRLAELTALKAEDLDRDTKTLKLSRKGGLQHRLKIQEYSKIEFLWDKYLFSLSLLSIKPVYLFSTKKLAFEKPITERSMSLTIMKCIIHADLTYKELTPHSFRKGCASEMYHKTKDLLLVRDYLNHQDAKVTQTYIELF